MKISNLALSTAAFLSLAAGSITFIHPKMANAEANRHVVYVTNDNGEVTFDESGNIISASDPSLLKDNEVYPASVVNNIYGRWVYYSDGFGSGRTGHSNFYSTKGRHFSWVKMGSKKSHYAYADSHAYSYSSQKGSGTFKCGYGFPQK